MRDLFPFIDRWVIPTDAGDNEDRIVLDGTTGKIQVYKGSDLVAEIDWDGIETIDTATGGFVKLNPTSVPPGNDFNSIQFHPANSPVGLDDERDGFIFSDIDAGIPRLIAQSPGEPTEQKAFLSLEASDGATPAQVRVLPEPAIPTAPFVFNVDGSESDIQLDNKSQPRGVIAQQIETGSFAAISATADTDLALSNVHVRAGRTYEIHLHTEARLTSDAATQGVWRLELTIDGVTHDRFWRLDEGAAAATVISTVDTCLYYTPAAEAFEDFVVRAVEQAAGATLDLPGGATARRTLTITDKGVL